MTQLLLFNITNGLIIGAFYVLMALGLSLILNLSNTINFAHGGFLVIGGDMYNSVNSHHKFFLRVPAVPPPAPTVVSLRLQQLLLLLLLCAQRARFTSPHRLS